MLTFTQIGTSLSATDIWTLEYRYNNICSNFDHSSGATEFSGNARINGGTAYRHSSTTTISLGTAPALTLGVSDGTYNSSGPQAFWVMTMSPVSNPYSGFSFGLTALSSIAASVFASVSFSNVDDASGLLGGYLGIQSGPITYGASSFALSRGGSCPV